VTTDFQHGRVALGQRLRELRTEGGLTGRGLAGRLGWSQSKVSKLETGRQTATVDDLRAWAETAGRPEAARELTARLRGLESRTRSWCRELAAGHRPVQDLINIEYERSTVMRAWEAAMIVGVLQTADYAWHVFSAYADLMESPRDTADAVRARMKRQEVLYQSGKQLHIVMSEAALRALICPPSVLAAQLDRIAGVIGLDTVSVGIVPWTAALKIPPANGFWIHDDRLVIVEDWHAELWLDDAESIALYRKVFDTLSSSAVYGAEAHRVIARARRAVDAS
jgi:transcriptional regulator with XRE-family HTH domain